MKIVLLNDSDKFLEIDSRLLPASKKLKLQNGFKKFSLFFGLAVVSVFIPVLHFVLVPVFLIISLISFFYGYRVEFQIADPKQCTCLQCTSDLVLPVLINGNRRLTCGACNAQYRVEG